MEQAGRLHGQGVEEYKLQKIQEEGMMKSNLDYENRLRGHMYQFDELQAEMRHKHGNPSGTAHHSIQEESSIIHEMV